MPEKLNQSSNQPEVYDTHLYDEFSKYAAFEPFQFLNGEKNYRESQKQQFLSGEIRNPALDYPELDLARLDEIEGNLLSQKQSVMSSEQNEVVRQAYRWRLNESIAQVRLLKAVADRDMRRFQRYNEFVYGKPSPDIFAFTVSSLREEAETAVTSDNPELKTCAEELLRLLPDLSFPGTVELPDDDTVEAARQQTTEELGDLISLPNQKNFEAAEIKNAFDNALQVVGAEGWQVVIDDKSSRTAVSISQEKQQAIVPESRTVDRKKMAGLIIHEIGTHVARRVNGERSRLKLLGLGLDRYVRGEEGVATMREHVIGSEVDDFGGFDGHLAIGLAYGLDGRPRDFREVYEVIEKTKLFNQLSKGKTREEALSKAQELAWNRCIRTFRGSDCQTPGTCFTQDIIYREGNIGVWNVIKNDSSEMLRFNVGKYDPANSRHIWVLEQLGISDSDLSALE